MNFSGSHILSIDQFDRGDVETIFNVADKMAPFAKRDSITKVLDGAILGSMFFEPSTRTRISFGSAFNLLGGSVRETTGFEHSAIAKGESLYDTARVLSGYSDVIVMRHPENGSVLEFSKASRVPVLNGGDGTNEHPSQALLDLYTIKNELAFRGRNIDQLRIAMVGDLKFGRTVHSLSQALDKFNNELHFISPSTLKMPKSVLSDLQGEWFEHEIFEEILPNLDVLYVTRIQRERFPDPEDYRKVAGAYQITLDVLKYAKTNLKILHPLPRVEEIKAEIDNTKHAVYFKQAFNGVPVRMVILEKLIGNKK